MCGDPTVDNNSTGLDNMNNIKVASLTSLNPQIELSVIINTQSDTLLQP